MEMLKFLEDSQYPSLSPQLRWMGWFGLWCPNPKSYSRRFKKIIFFLTITFFITQYIKCIMDCKMESLQIVLNYAPCHLGIVKSSFFKKDYKRWTLLIDFISKTERKQVEGDREKDKIVVKGYIRKNRLLTYFYWIFGLVNHVILYYPIYTRVRKGERQSSIFLNIFDDFGPLSLGSRGYYVVMIIHVILGVNVGMYVIGFDSLFMAIMMFFTNQLKIAKQYAKEVVNLDDSGESHRNIQKCHKFYFNLIEQHNRLDSIIYPVMLLYLVVIIINLGICIINIVDTQDDFGKLISYLIFLQGCFTQLALFYWLANEITEESMDVSYGTYDSDWYYCNQSLKKEIHLLGTSMNKRLVLRAGPIQEMTLTTFVSILRGSYSMYTLLHNTK